MAITSMEDLLVHELRDLYNAEKQLIKALPSMAEAASDEGLVAALESHLVQTEEQARRLELCFDALGVAVKGKKCAAMEGLIEEATGVMEDCEDDNVRDAAIIGAAQRVEHYEISAYGTARAFAEELGHDEVVEFLTATLEEEAAADELLTTLAESRVNAAAESGSDSDEDAGESDSTRPAGKGQRSSSAANPASTKASPKRSSGSRRETSK